MSFATGRKITFALSTALAALLLVAVVAVISTERLISAQAWVSHTYDMRGELRVLDDQLDDAMSAVRGYMLTGDPEFVNHYRVSVDSAGVAYDSLRRITAGDVLEQRSLIDLRELLIQREAHFRVVLSRGTALPIDSSAAMRDLQVDEALYARMDAMIGLMDRREEELLASRTASEAANARSVLVLVLSLAGIAAMLAIVVWVSVRRDLMGRARAENALQASEAKFAGILAIADDGIVSVNDRYEIVHFNRGAERIFGWSAGEVIGRSLDILLPERFKGVHRSYVLDFANAPETAHRYGERPEVTGRRRNGEEFTAEASISKLTTGGEKLLAVVLRDITERKRRERLEHALAAIGGKMATSLAYGDRLAVVANLPVPVVGSWCLLDVAEPMETGGAQMLRVPSKHAEAERDALLRAFADATAEKPRPAVALDVMHSAQPQLLVDAAAMLPGEGPDSELRELVTAMGSRSLLIVPLVRGSSVIGTMTIGSTEGADFTDVDLDAAVIMATRGALAIENGRLFRKAQRATVARDHVLGIVSHDLRNPLSAIAMCARTMRDNPPASDQHRNTLSQTILDATELMQRLLQDLLDISSIEAGHLSVEPDEAPLAPIFEATRELFAGRAAAQAVHLEVGSADGMPRVIADSGRIVQALGNLIGNSLKFTPPGGLIRVTAARRDGDVMISVSDTGCGIEAADVPHLFERFWHGRSVGGARGFGLGLAIVQGIVAAHGGRVWVESEVGKGTTMSFILAAVPGGAAISPPPAGPALAAQAR